MNDTEIGEYKAELRRRMRERLRRVTQDDLVEAKLGVFEQLWHSELLDDGTVLLGYYPHGNEVPCTYFLRIWLSHGRDLLLPRVAADGLAMNLYRMRDILSVTEGYRGIMEPDPEECSPAGAESVEAVLVPGLAFSSSGARLGQGGGHYDRLLPRLAPGCVRIGLCYDWQVLGPEEIPAAIHDEFVEYLCTPTGLIRCRKATPPQTR